MDCWGRLRLEHVKSEPRMGVRAESDMAHLVTLPEDEALRDMAAVLLDKVIFLLAVNSYRGGLSGTHGCTSASTDRSDST